MKYFKEGYFCSIRNNDDTTLEAEVKIEPPTWEFIERLGEIFSEDSLLASYYSGEEVYESEYVVIKYKTNSIENAKQMITEIIRRSKENEAYPYITNEDIEELMEDYYKVHSDALDVSLDAEIYDEEESIPYEIPQDVFLEMIQEGIITNLDAETSDFDFENYVSNKIEEYCNDLINDSGAMGRIIDEYKENIEWDYADRDLDR